MSRRSRVQISDLAPAFAAAARTNAGVGSEARPPGSHAAISVSMPTVRATRDDLERLAPLVVETADALSASIGRRAVVDQEEDR